VQQLPRKQNYMMPAEWHSHAGTQMHWPSNRETWPGKRLEKVEKVYLDIIEVLTRYEPVHLFLENERIKKHAVEQIRGRNIDVDRLIFHVHPINDVWARDCGPIFIRRQQNGEQEFAITDWIYNAWGEKYPPFDDDNRLPQYFAEKYNLKRFDPEMVLEGGAIDSNGNGVLLTTESVLLHPNRNPGMSHQEITQRLKDYLGVQKIIWLKGGLAGDDTDGHVDGIARFLSEDTILVMVSENPADINYDALRKNLEIATKATDQFGKSLNIEQLSMPNTKIEGTTVDGSEHVPASYANFYVANGIVLVPTYGDGADQQALKLFRRYFPDREISGIPCNDLVWGQGGIHCITQPLYSIA
jgi:agmatine deiminase